MIKLKSIVDCCGCGACSQRCPKSCISMIEDSEGFKYPNINTKQCINCGLCEKVCPILNEPQTIEPIECWAMKNKDTSIVENSSSGGVFTFLAEQILNLNGIICGALFDENWNVYHGLVETKEDLKKLRTSKYVQSNTTEIMKSVETLLKSGRIVLFSGTPCQVAGLKLFLRKEYDNLYLIDIVCHGVPSPKIWNMYLDEITGGNTNKISSINFRDKSTGWSNYSVKITCNNKTIKQKYQDHPYMQLFLNDFNIRPCCYICHFKNHKSFADLTIGDYWGINNIQNFTNDDTGVNLVMVRTVKGLQLIKNKDNLLVKQTNSNLLFQNAIYRSATIRVNRNVLWKYLKKDGVIKTKNRYKLSVPYKQSATLYFVERIINKISKNKTLYNKIIKLYFSNNRL